MKVDSGPLPSYIKNTLKTITRGPFSSPQVLL